MSTLRHTSHNFVTIALNALAGLAVTVVAARYLSPAGMGAYSLLFWLVGMAAILVNLGGVNTTLKHVAQAQGRGDPHELAGVLAHGFYAWGLRCAGVVLLWLAAVPALRSLYPQHDFGLALPLAVALIVPLTLFTWLVGACQGVQGYAAVARGTTVWTLSLAAGTGVVVGAGASLLGLLVAQVVAASASTVVLWHFLADGYPAWWRAQVSQATRSELWRYGVPVAAMVLLDALVWQRSGIFFLGQWAPPPEVAYYALAFGLAQMLMRAIPGALVGLLIPSMSRAAGAGELDAVAVLYRTAGRWMALLALPVMVLAIGGGAVLVNLLYGAAYAPVVAPLSILLAASAATMVWGFPASSVLYALDGQHRLLAVGFAAALVYLLLAVWLIPTGGAMGAAWATAGAQVFSLVPGAIFARRCLRGVGYDWRAWSVVVVASGLLAAALAVALQLLPGVGGWFLGACVGGSSYVLVVWHGGAVKLRERQRLKQAVMHSFQRVQSAVCSVTGITPVVEPRL